MADNCGRVHDRLGRSEIRGRRKSDGKGRERRCCAGVAEEGEKESLESQARLCGDREIRLAFRTVRAVYGCECVTNKCLPAAKRTGICIRTHNATGEAAYHSPPLVPRDFLVPPRSTLRAVSRILTLGPQTFAFIRERKL